MLCYCYTQTYSLILLYCLYSYCVSYFAILDGVCLSGNKRITYLLIVDFISIAQMMLSFTSLLRLF